jgi:hypothetical protein
LHRFASATMKVNIDHLKSDCRDKSSRRHLSDAYTPQHAMTTPTASNTEKPANTPDTVVSEESASSSDNEADGSLENEIEEIHWESTRSTEALFGPTKGIRIGHLQLDSHIVSSRRQLSDSHTRQNEITTPAATNADKPFSTPDTVVSEESAFSSDNEADANLENELEEAQWEASLSMEALLGLAKGIRIVTHLMQRYHHNPDLQAPSSRRLAVCNSREKSAKGSSELKTSTNLEDHHPGIYSSFMSEGGQPLADLTQELGSVIGSDLLRLINTANTVRDHIRLLSEEASTLDDHVIRAGDEAEKAKNRAEVAEAMSLRLYKQNALLKKRVTKLNMHRSVLVNEIKKLRTAAEEIREQDSLSRIVGAMRIHEAYLRYGRPENENNLLLSRKNDTLMENDLIQASICKVANAASPSTAMIETENVELGSRHEEQKQASYFVFNKSDTSCYDDNGIYPEALEAVSSKENISQKSLPSRVNRDPDLKVKCDGSDSILVLTSGRPCDGGSIKAASGPKKIFSGGPFSRQNDVQGGGFRMKRFFQRGISPTRDASTRSPLISLENVTVCGNVGPKSHELREHSETNHLKVNPNGGEFEVFSNIEAAFRRTTLASATPVPVVVGNVFQNVKPTSKPLFVALPPDDDDCSVEEIGSPRVEVGPGLYLV